MCSMKKGVLRNFTKWTGKHLCQSLFFNKVAGLRSATLLKKRLWLRCFHVNFAKFLRTPFFQNTSGRLRLCYARRTVSITDILELPWGMKRTSSMKRFFAKVRLSAAILLVLQVLIVLSEILVLLQYYCQLEFRRYPKPLGFWINNISEFRTFWTISK